MQILFYKTYKPLSYFERVVSLASRLQGLEYEREKMFLKITNHPTQEIIINTKLMSC